LKAMVLERLGSPLVFRDIDEPVVYENQILVKVIACGVCRTDLHIIDGDLTEPKLPLIPGHEIVGEVLSSCRGLTDIKIGDIVGIPWLGSTCGQCKYCLNGRENLCDKPCFTGYNINGGYAEYVAADYRYCFKITDKLDPYHAAPLMCAGLIGYRSYKMCGSNIKKLGIYGFGAAAHIITQIAVQQGVDVFAFTRKGDIPSQEFALSLGAVWSGSSEDIPPQKLDASVIFAPVGEIVPNALKALDKGGVLVCGGIHMSNIPEFEYKLLWEERIIRSVANLTREDGLDFFKTISANPVNTEIVMYDLKDANRAICDLREGRIKGAAVLKVS